MITVDAIMTKYASVSSIPRESAKSVINALRTIPGFQEKKWQNEFCHGKYTSPAGEWTAEDETGSVRISWSVNAATGADNGYSISRDSWWTSALVKSAKSCVLGSESTVKRLANKAADERRYADGKLANATSSLLMAHRHLTAAAKSRRAGRSEETTRNLILAAQERRAAARDLTARREHFATARSIDRQRADEMWVIGQVNARIIAGGEMLRNWTAPIALTSLGYFPGHTRETVPGGKLEPVPTWQRELFEQVI